MIKKIEPAATVGTLGAFGARAGTKKEEVEVEEAEAEVEVGEWRWWQRWRRMRRWRWIWRCMWRKDNIYS